MDEEKLRILKRVYYKNERRDYVAEAEGLQSYKLFEKKAVRELIENYDKLRGITNQSSS